MNTPPPKDPREHWRDHQVSASRRDRGNQRPESANQAAEWQRVMTAYESAGLCPRDAAQAAWGHQNSFSTIRTPCPTCQPVIDGFPEASNHPFWRRFARGREAGRTVQAVGG